MASHQAFGGISQISSSSGGIVVVASAARTANGNTAADVTENTGKFRNARAIFWVLDITAVSGTAPTLDVAILAKLVGKYGVVVQFTRQTAVTTQVLAHKRDVPPGQTIPANSIQLTLDTVANIAVTGNQNVFSMVEWDDTFQSKWLIGGTTPSFTFSLTAYPIF